MSTREIDLFIKSNDLALVDGELQSRRFRSGADLEFLKPHWDQIVEALEGRVVPFRPPRTASAEDLDPWRHVTPSLERMAKAKALLAYWRKRGFKMRVEAGTSIKALDLYNARTFVSPAYLKPEMLWLLMEDDPGLARPEASGMSPAYFRSGGVA